MAGALALAAWGAAALAPQRSEGLGERPGAFVTRLLIGLLAVLATGHFASGRALDWYSRTGYSETAYRGGSPATRVQLLQSLAETIDERLVDYTALMTRALDDHDPGVRAAAVRSLGRVGERMVRSVALLERGEKGAAWPRQLLQQLRVDVEPRLRALAGQPGPLRRDAVSALAALQADHVLDLVVRALAEAPDATAFEAGLVDLVRAAEPGPGLEALGPLASGAAADRAAGLLWAAARLVESAEEAGLEVAFPPGLVASVAGLAVWPDAAACVAAEALIPLRMAAARDGLLALAGRTGAVCAAHELATSGASHVVFSRARSLQVAAVEALAAIARGDARLAEALRALAARPDTPSEVAASARRVAELAGP